MSPRVFAALALAAGAAGCVSEVTDTTALPERGVPALALPAAEAARVLDLLNYPATTAARLDNEVGLDARVATDLVAHRDGPDGLAPSADDDPFDDLAELDAIPYVGEPELALLLAFAQQQPAPAGEAIHGVRVLGWESESILWGVNQATVEELDAAVGLGSEIASTLVATRPFATTADIGRAPGVDAGALGALRAYAGVWWDARLAPPPPDHEEHDGVAFDASTARIALDIANRATHEELVAAGIWSSIAARIIAGRRYARLADVAAVEGIGRATMTALRDFAASGTWSPAPAPL